MNQDAPEFLFRVLRHDGIPEPHYDLLIETSRKARVPTWRLPVWPITGATRAIRLEDHRRHYLQYSGPISGNRGHVRGVEFGTHRTRRARMHWRVEFHSHSAIRGCELKRLKGREWEATPITYR